MVQGGWMERQQALEGVAMVKKKEGGRERENECDNKTRTYPLVHFIFGAISAISFYYNCIFNFV
jgi:hypothetical protein